MIENMTYDNIDKLLQDKNINPQEYFESVDVKNVDLKLHSVDNLNYF